MGVIKREELDEGARTVDEAIDEARQKATRRSEEEPAQPKDGGGQTSLGGAGTSGMAPSREES